MTQDTRKGIQGNDSMLQLCRPHNEADIPMQEHTVERDDHLPLRFHGYLIGQNDVIAESDRGTYVSIFATRRGRIVTSVHQWQRDERRNRERHSAAVHEKAQDALAWLIEDGGGALGKASRWAWERACQVWPPLQGHDVEVIE